MLSPLDFLSDLINPLLSFLPKALLVAMVCSVVAGVIGSHVVLRGKFLTISGAWVFQPSQTTFWSWV